MAILPRGSRLISGAKTGTFGFTVSGIYAMPGVPLLLRDIVDTTAQEFRGPALAREAHIAIDAGDVWRAQRIELAGQSLQRLAARPLVDLLMGLEPVAVVVAREVSKELTALGRKPGEAL